MQRKHRLGILLGSAALALMGVQAGAAATKDASAPDPTKLRICAASSEAPYSSADGSGFENKIAVVLARQMGLEPEFVWAKKPAIYLVRDFLDQDQCDVVMGVDTGDERVLTTQPYYRSGYVFVTRADAGPPPKDWDAPELRTAKRIALGFGTPAEVMLKAIGRYEDDAAYLYSLVDFKSPRNQYVRIDPQRMVGDVVSGEAAVAVGFAPEMARYVRSSATPLVMTLIPDTATQANGEKVPQQFDQSIGVRKDDAALRDRLDAALRQAAPAIQEVLTAEGIPTLPPQG